MEHNLKGPSDEKTVNSLNKGPQRKITAIGASDDGQVILLLDDGSRVGLSLKTITSISMVSEEGKRRGEANN